MYCGVLMQNSQETYECLAGLGVLYSCPRPLFSVYEVASLSLGYYPAREHSRFSCVLVSI